MRSTNIQGLMEFVTEGHSVRVNHSTMLDVFIAPEERPFKGRVRQQRAFRLPPL